jgi:AcrR family transcriptional regulator
MPRSFSAAERTRVQQRLLSVAREHFGRFGYRKASIGDIARDAGIAKGSVYLFHRSKVDLFVAAAAQVEDEMRMRILAAVGDPPASVADHLRRLFRLQVDAFADHPFLRVVNDPAEAGALFRDLPDEAAAELRSSDERFFAGLVARWAGTPGERVDPELLMAAGRAIYAVGLQRPLVGERRFAEATELLIEGVAREMERRVHQE